MQQQLKSEYEAFKFITSFPELFFFFCRCSVSVGYIIIMHTCKRTRNMKERG